MTDVRTFPRLVIVITAIAAAGRGDPYYGAFCLLVLGAVSIAGRSGRVSPTLELAVLGLMVVDMTLGNALGLYGHLPWLDKALHVACAALIAGVVVRALERGDRPQLPIAAAAVLVTLGVGAAWEIAEFGVDRVLGRQTQRAPAMSPLDDTMLDLILDAAGGALGVMLAWRAAHRERLPA